MTSAQKDSTNQMCGTELEQMPALACEFQSLLSGLRGKLAVVCGIDVIQELVLIDSCNWPCNTSDMFMIHQLSTESLT